MQNPPHEPRSPAQTLAADGQRPVTDRRAASASPQEVAPTDKTPKKIARLSDRQTIQALREVGNGAIENARRAQACLLAVVNKEMALTLTVFNNVEVVVVRLKAGQELNEQIGEELAKLVGRPLLCLPEGIELVGLDDAQLDAAGLAKKVKLEIARG